MNRFCQSTYRYFVQLHKTGGVFLAFYDIFERLCSEKGVTPAKVRADLEISQSTMASWKSRGLTPRYDTSKRIAAYFGVDVDDLLTEKEHADAVIDYVKERLESLSHGPIDRVTRDMSQMTQEGQEKVANYAADILPSYRRQDVPQSTLDSTEGKGPHPAPRRARNATRGRIDGGS